MAKYYASPFGIISGQVGDEIGSGWKGIRYIKKYTIPTDKGSLIKYQQMKAGTITPDKFSFPQFNLRRVIMNPLMYAGRQNPIIWIEQIWGEECKSRHLRMSGLNLLVKANVSNLYGSMNKNIEFDPITNTPDLTKLVVAIGELEGTQSLTCSYNPTTGVVSFVWNKNCYTNGKATDIAYGMVIAKPILNSFGEAGNWEPALRVFGPTQLTGQPTRGGLGTGTGLLSIPQYLYSPDLIGFVFFFTVVEERNLYSVSISAQST